LVQRGGLVKKVEVHQMVIKKVVEVSLRLDFSIQGLTFSPLKGTSGNIEYLIYLTKNYEKEKISYSPQLIEEVVDQAHQELSLKK
jgi:23S rRNA (cytidine1920-2'-O)/16S rRNA (cytidine1409-2'-O)-methyltransferase